MSVGFKSTLLVVELMICIGFLVDGLEGSALRWVHEMYILEACPIRYEYVCSWEVKIKYVPR